MNDNFINNIKKFYKIINMSLLFIKHDRKFCNE